MKTYIFKVKLKHVWRKIEILGRQTLDDLHMAIPLENKMRTIFSLIRGSHPERRLPATTVRIESLNLKPKQRFLYLFDYGDEWRFEVEFLKEGSSEKTLYPRIIDSRGEAPQQYPDYEEEES